jgi:hypothetical protein
MRELRERLALHVHLRLLQSPKKGDKRETEQRIRREGNASPLKLDSAGMSPWKDAG